MFFFSWVLLFRLQFKVHRDGCWSKINFRRAESASNTADESRDLSANPWIRHFRSGSRHQSVTIPSLQGKTALATTNWFRVPQPDLCSHDSVGSDTGRPSVKFSFWNIHFRCMIIHSFYFCIHVLFFFIYYYSTFMLLLQPNLKFVFQNEGKGIKTCQWHTKILLVVYFDSKISLFNFFVL